MILWLPVRESARTFELAMVKCYLCSRPTMRQLNLRHFIQRRLMSRKFFNAPSYFEPPAVGRQGLLSRFDKVFHHPSCGAISCDNLPPHVGFRSFRPSIYCERFPVIEYGNQLV